MKNFKVECKWTTIKTVYVEANDWEEAEELALDKFAAGNEDEYWESNEDLDTEEV